MKKDWKVKFYRNDEGECPVEDFLKTLSKKDRHKIQVWLDVLEDEGIDLHRPHSDYLRDGIHELRVRLSRGETRTLYFFYCGDHIVLTHTFYKRTDEVPDVEINRALIYKQDTFLKYNKETIGEL